MGDWKRVVCLDPEMDETFAALINFDNVATIVPSDKYEGYSEILTANDYIYIAAVSVDDITKILRDTEPKSNEPMLVKLKPNIKEIIAAKPIFGEVSLQSDPVAVEVAKRREKRVVKEEKHVEPNGKFIWKIEQEPTDGKARWVTLERSGDRYGEPTYTLAFWGSGEGLDVGYEEADELTQAYTQKTLQENGEKR